VLVTLLAGVAGVVWLLFFQKFRQDFFEHYYFMPLLGIIAATIANTTPAAAGIVYFPILTKLHISPVATARFSLMIQAYGMGLGTLKWLLVDRRLFMMRVIPLCLAGGMVGGLLSVVFLPLSNPKMLQLLFSGFALIVVQFIFYGIIRRRRYLRETIELTLRNSLVLFFCSLAGGMISGWIGFGIDTVFYFVLTVFYQINPAVAIITSIAIMAGVSIWCTLLNILFHSVPLALWYSAIPGVTLGGLFLASYVALKLGTRNVLLLFTLFLCMDFMLTLWTQEVFHWPYLLKSVLVYSLAVTLMVMHIRLFKQSLAERRDDES